MVTLVGLSDAEALNAASMFLVHADSTFSCIDDVCIAGGADPEPSLSIGRYGTWESGSFGGPSKDD